MKIVSDIFDKCDFRGCALRRSVLRFVKITTRRPLEVLKILRTNVFSC